MSYCLNPDCQKPQNLTQSNFCQSCGSKLLLKDRYRALQPIGEGGFGRTFLSIDEHRLKTRCVIKQFLPQAKGSGTLKQSAMDKAIRLFNQEAVRLDELGEHPQIPTLLAYFEQDNRLYLVQQFIEGKNLLQELQQQGLFDEQKIRELLADLLPVLQFVHDRQVIHRDIKPGNILRRQQDNKFILIDFGVAKLLSTDDSLAKPGTKIGTEGYAPIEQWRGGKAYPASDLYSLGATCLYLLTRVKPDSLYDPLTGRWLWRDHLTQRGLILSERLGQVLDRLLRDAVTERYQSADAVLRDLNLTASPTRPPTVPTLSSASAPIIAAGSPKTQAQNWRSASTLIGHTDRVRSVAISPGGQILISGSTDKTIKLWRIENGELLRTMTGHTGPVHAVAVNPRGRILVSASADKTVKLWRLGTGELLHTLTQHTNWVNTLAISPDGNTLASGSEDKTIKLWNLEQGTLLRTLAGHTGAVQSLVFSPDNQTLISGSSDKTVKLWRSENGELLNTLARHSGRVNSIAISPNGQILATGSEDSTIKLWHFGTGQLFQTLTEHTDAIFSIAISPDSQTLISGSSDKTVNLWNLNTGQLQCTLSGHSWWVTSVAISPNGQTIASGSADKIIQLWKATL